MWVVTDPAGNCGLVHRAPRPGQFPPAARLPRAPWPRRVEVYARRYIPPRQYDPPTDKETQSKSAPVRPFAPERWRASRVRFWRATRWAHDWARFASTFFPICYAAVLAVVARPNSRRARAGADQKRGNITGAPFLYAGLAHARRGGRQRGNPGTGPGARAYPAPLAGR